MLILYLCSPPGSCHICCITLGTCHAYILLCTSSSIHKHTQNTQVLLWPLSSTGGMYTSPDFLAQSSSCTPRHTQLTYTEVPIDADTLRSTGRTPWQQAHRLAQSLPPQHPFKTDRQNQTHDIPTATGIHTGALETRMLPPDHASVTHTSARELPAADSAGHRNPSSSAGAAMSIALVANKDSATARLV